MIDSCTIRRPTGTEPDPMTGLDVSTYAAEPVYAGKCEVKASTAIEPRGTDSATSQVTVQVTLLKIPTSAAALLPGDYVEFADDTATERLRGTSARVSGTHVGTYTTAQRVPITVLPGVTPS